MVTGLKEKMKDVAYSKLRERILSGSIPPKASLSEEAMAKELGVSRTPIREAVLMLEADGLLKIYPNKGPVVIGLGFEDMIWISQIREGLEGIAARIACDAADKSRLLDLRKELEKNNDLEQAENKETSFRIGREIHKIILESTGNHRMIRIVENMTDQLERIMVLSRSAPRRAELTLEQHFGIIDAVLEGNYDEAEKRVRNHIISVTNDAIQIYQKSYL